MSGGHSSPVTIAVTHVELAALLKEYLGHRHDEDFLESTTAEVRRALAGPLATRPGVGEAGQPALEVLRACDLVKFARHRPAPKEIEGVYDAAVTLVDETKLEGASEK